MTTHDIATQSTKRNYHPAGLKFVLIYFAIFAGILPLFLLVYLLFSVKTSGQFNSILIAFPINLIVVISAIGTWKGNNKSKIVFIIFVCVNYFVIGFNNVFVMISGQGTGSEISRVARGILYPILLIFYFNRLEVKNYFKGVFHNEIQTIGPIRILGLYSIRARQRVHLFEVMIKDCNGIPEFSDFTQEINGQPRDNWQIPWDEKILNYDGTEVIANDYDMDSKPELWVGNIRLIFFFHGLDLSKPLKTPFGEVNLPNETMLPVRLFKIKYNEPD